MSRAPKFYLYQSRYELDDTTAIQNGFPSSFQLGITQRKCPRPHRSPFQIILGFGNATIDTFEMAESLLSKIQIWSLRQARVFR